ncbi:MAG: FHA domain-containing protein [Sandaracinus sp.]|nr:FHA domain-containing protein [Sandaracinus sp.]MCB9632412.1 FHA domain-containing protein [Sandaracinus sp.]
MRVEIGRAPSKDLCFDDPSVNASHAVIEARDGRLFVRDLDSSFGTFVRGERVTETEVVWGDEVRFGQVALAWAHPALSVLRGPLSGSVEERRAPLRTGPSEGLGIAAMLGLAALGVAALFAAVFMPHRYETEQSPSDGGVEALDAGSP